MTRKAVFAAWFVLPFVAYWRLSATDSLQINPRPALPYPPMVSTESQCGPVNDLQQVELYDGSLGISIDYVRHNEPSTALFQWLPASQISMRLPAVLPGNVGEARWCTGTLISDNLVLTAGHCFDVQRNQFGWTTPFRPGPDGQPLYEAPETLATLFVVQFGYQVSRHTGLPRTPFSFPAEQLLEYRRGGLDYAIVRLAKDRNGLEAGSLVKPALVASSMITPSDRLAIIQHPNGEPKSVGAGALLKQSGSDLFYDDIDTLGGSSGSAVRNQEGAIAGVHTHGGCLPQADRNRINANIGVDIKAIAEVSDVF
jgi:Trypsin-like peptidase domain